MIDVLQDNGDDSVIQELASFVAAMSEDEQIDPVAMAWLGRDDDSLEDWGPLRAEANYLLGMPLVSDYLEEALSLFGRSCEDVEMNRL